MGEKIEIYKFTEEEMTMYNTTLTGAITLTFLDVLQSKGLAEELKSVLLEPGFVENVFKPGVEQKIDQITKGKFNLDLFKYTEDKEDE